MPWPGGATAWNSSSRPMPRKPIASSSNLPSLGSCFRWSSTNARTTAASPPNASITECNWKFIQLDCGQTSCTARLASSAPAVMLTSTRLCWVDPVFTFWPLPRKRAYVTETVRRARGKIKTVSTANDCEGYKSCTVLPFKAVQRLGSNPTDFYSGSYNQSKASSDQH